MMKSLEYCVNVATLLSPKYPNDAYMMPMVAQCQGWPSLLIDLVRLSS